MRLLDSHMASKVKAVEIDGPPLRHELWVEIVRRAASRRRSNCLVKVWEHYGITAQQRKGAKGAPYTFISALNAYPMHIARPRVNLP